LTKQAGGEQQAGGPVLVGKGKLTKREGPDYHFVQRKAKIEGKGTAKEEKEIKESLICVKEE